MVRLQKIKEMLDGEKVEVGFVENASHLAKLQAAGRRILPRGAFLFIGGDTSYHISDYATLADRFQNPFCWASRDLHKPGGWPEEIDHRHPLFGIPGNHDYYDALDGFNRQFRRPATGEDVASNERSPLLALPTFMRCQEASYIALQLPHKWWFWGFDTENGDMDFRQKEFFRQLKEKTKPDKLIVATSQPTTVFGKYAKPDEPLVVGFKGLELETPFLKDAPKLNESECRLDLSGDVHHYARYWGPNSSNLPGNKQSADNYASVVSGIGGAFLHPSQTDINEVEEQALFPTKEKSRRAVAEQILNFWNLVMGGYVWLLGFLLAFIIYFGATFPQSSREVVNCIPLFHKTLKITQCNQIRPTVQSSAPSEQVYYWGLNAAPKPGGYFLWALALVMSVLAITGLVIYSNYMFKEIFKEQARRREASEPPLSLIRIATSKKFWGFWILLAVAVLTLIYGMWNFAFTIPPSRITPFGCSMIVLVSLVWGACAIIQSFLYSEWLFHQAYDITVKWYDYWPIWVLVGFAVVVTGSSLWRFGKYNLPAYFVSDIIFALMILLVFLGLIYFAVSTGGALQSRRGKILFALFGLWHAILQLFVAFLLVKRGSLVSFGLMLISIFIFRYFGVKLVKQHSGWLALLWLVYGLWLLYVPFILPESTSWPRVSDLLIRYLAFPDFPQFSLLLTCIVAGLVGLVMTCVSFGWYLAVSLAFNGHNNEAGGAARIERFKGFVRLCVTKDALKVYVIGFEKPEIDGHKLKLKIIDMFQLKCS